MFGKQIKSEIGTTCRGSLTQSGSCGTVSDVEVLG